MPYLGGDCVAYYSQELSYISVNIEFKFYRGNVLYLSVDRIYPLQWYRVKYNLQYNSMQQQRHSMVAVSCIDRATTH